VFAANRADTLAAFLKGYSVEKAKTLLKEVETYEDLYMASADKTWEEFRNLMKTKMKMEYFFNRSEFNKMHEQFNMEQFETFSEIKLAICGYLGEHGVEDDYFPPGRVGR
jgi:hypothetical protein